MIGYGEPFEEERHETKKDQLHILARVAGILAQPFAGFLPGWICPCDRG